MNRRQALKLLAAVPIASVLTGCRERERDHEGEEHPTERLEIHLDGAFAVVIRQNKANSILAFSPRPAGVKHELHLNGNPRAEDTARTIHFDLQPDSVRKEEQSDINAGFRDFYFQTDKWRVPDSLIVLELPCPKAITFSGRIVPATFASDGREVWMPTNHILEYDVHRDRKTRLTCRDLGEDRCAPATDSPAGLTRYFFEVGPVRSTKNHPVDFFNYILHTSFPDLEARYSLRSKSIGEQRSSIGTGRFTPAAWQFQYPEGLFQPATYILDCEYGGPLLNVNTQPA